MPVTLYSAVHSGSMVTVSYTQLFPDLNVCPRVTFVYGTTLNFTANVVLIYIFISLSLPLSVCLSLSVCIYIHIYICIYIYTDQCIYYVLNILYTHIHIYMYIYIYIYIYIHVWSLLHSSMLIVPLSATRGTCD